MTRISKNAVIGSLFLTFSSFCTAYLCRISNKLNFCSFEGLIISNFLVSASMYFIVFGYSITSFVRLNHSLIFLLSFKGILTFGLGLAAAMIAISEGQSKVKGDLIYSINLGFHYFTIFFVISLILAFYLFKSKKEINNLTLNENIQYKNIDVYLYFQ